MTLVCPTLVQKKMSGVVTFVKGSAMLSCDKKTLPKNVTLILPAIGLAQDTVVSDELFEAVKEILNSDVRMTRSVKIAGIPCYVVPPGSDYLDFDGANSLEAWTCSGEHLNEWYITEAESLGEIVKPEPIRHIIFGPATDIRQYVTDILEIEARLPAKPEAKPEA